MNKLIHINSVVDSINRKHDNPTMDVRDVTDANDRGRTTRRYQRSWHVEIRTCDHHGAVSGNRGVGVGEENVELLCE